MDIYGEPTDIDENGKVELVFHENEYMITNNYAGYFSDINVKKEYYRAGKMDILYINSDFYIQKNMNQFSTKCIDTIVHELQHCIDEKRNPYSAEKSFDEGLSLSTYFIIHNGSDSGRTSDFRDNEIANGQYFFDWPLLTNKSMGVNYKTSANFMYWLYLHGGGEKIIRDIVSVSEHKQIDYKSVGEAASRNIPDLKNKNIPKIATYELSDSGRNWLLLFNYGSDNRTVYINPSASSRSVRSYSREEESEWYDFVISEDDKVNKYEENDIIPEPEIKQ